MRPYRPLIHSATSPSLLPFPSAAPISKTPEHAPSRDGAISRLDRYSKILPPIPPSHATIIDPSRLSGLRNVTFASAMENRRENNETPRSLPSSSIETPQNQRIPQHFGLASARKSMKKVFSSMRPAPIITGISLRRKNSAPTLRSPSNSTNKCKKLEIGAPTGVVKKTPEELVEMLRALGSQADDPPSNVGHSASSSKERTGAPAAVEGAGIEAGEVHERKRGERPKRSDSMDSISTGASTGPPVIPPAESTRKPQLSAKQRGKLPARKDTMPSVTTATSNASTLVPDTSDKPVGWYATATLDEIRATIPKFKKEDMIPAEEIPDFVTGLLRDFEALKSASAWRCEQIDREVEALVEAHLAKMCGDKEVLEGGVGEDEDEDEDVDEDGNKNYTWGEFGEPDPRFVDCGWGQMDVSSRGVGKRWFIFGDVKDVLGGSKCPLTHGGFEEDGEHVGSTEKLAIGDEAEMSAKSEKAGNAGRFEQTKNARQSIRIVNDEDINDEDNDDDSIADADADYDEDAHLIYDGGARQLLQEEILRREGML
ncbi:hypothetical protein DSL72_004632 [Monilinia vaccinii-corymbosi]|uniref:Uncharacterized protein n=1 Tax=Monilinia vaccinii-corymbosi TaxID=61207 RepID=A0A8A3NZR0_9HELO|nr:hypothetical protein DSL72_004632 [Monilinia vaccinii-corymbosi]